MKILKSKPYIIGETSFNHEGNLKYLYSMIDDIAELELNAIKYHFLLNLDGYMTKDHPIYSDLKKWLFTKEEWTAILDYTIEKKLDIVALCNDIDSVKFILSRDIVNAIEIHSTGLNDYLLLDELAEFQGKIILGVGGSSIDEIDSSINYLKDLGKDDIMLMYGFQNYPTNYENINLSKMIKLKDLFGLPIGYADHTAFNEPFNETISIMGAIMGIPILEKHYTLNYGEKRVDFESAVGKEQMQKIKNMMEMTLLVYGDESLKMSNNEIMYGNTGPMKKAIIARHNIKKGEQLSKNNLCFKRTKNQSYIKQNDFTKLIGLETSDDIQEDEVIDYKKVKYEFKPLPK